MTRRSFLFASAAGLSCSQAPQAPSRPPNVFLIIGDDMSWYDAGCYGSTQSNTPNIDRLASEGMLFERAFTATAMCAPMRQQLYTGLFPVRNGAYPNHSRTKDGVKSIPHYFEPLGYRVGLWGKEHFGPQENYPFEKLGSRRDDEMEYDKIQEFVQRDPDQPYFVAVCSHDSHLPYESGDPSKYDPEKLELPPYFYDSPNVRKSYAAYLAEVEHLDEQTGECMRIVEESGQSDNTIFIFCSEQGSQFAGGKWTCYEAGLREAWVLRWPERVAAGSTTSAMIQGVDALPTLIEAAGGDPAAHDFDGESYLAVLEGNEQIHADYVYGVQTTRGIIAGSENYPVRSVRDERYKLIWNLNYSAKFENILTAGRDQAHYWMEWVELAKTDEKAAAAIERYQVRPEFELYDLDTDSWELDNLAGAPEHAERLAALKANLETFMQQQGDRGIETEAEALTRRINAG